MPNIQKHKFGEILTFTLKEKNISQKDLAKEIGASTNTMCCYCKNKRLPSLKAICKIADFLDMSIDELLDRQAPKSSRIRFENQNIQYIANIYDVLNENGKILLKTMAENIICNTDNVSKEKINNYKDIITIYENSQTHKEEK